MAVFHLKVSYGSCASGNSAVAKDEYIEREGRYDGDRSELEHSESGHMPEWATEDAHAYWEAADAHERANGRLYSEVVFALPVELDEGQRRELAQEFAQSLTGEERLPYTLAIHRGGPNGENPHAHLMFSERGNDGIERSAEQWFRRYNGKAPERGGARKSRAGKAGDWLSKARERWEREANRALERAGAGERIDHRSLAERREEARGAGDLERAAELSREPNVHLGPERYRTLRGGESETVERARGVEERNAEDVSEREADRQQVERLEQEIAEVEAMLKEVHERVRKAIDERVKQARRAIRRGSEAAGRAGRALGRTGARISRAIRAGPGARGRADRGLGRKHAEVRRACDEIDLRLRGSFGKREQNDQRLQRCCEGFGRAHALIHPEAERKRNAAGQPDRVEGLIESRIQDRVRSRSGPDLG